MQRYGQLVDVAAFAGEVLEVLPSEHAGYYAICGAEADALMGLGASDRALARYREATGIIERLTRAEPDRADFQRDLSVSYERIGDLYQALGQGDAAREMFQQALEIAERLARAEPRRADFQFDLVASLQRMANFAADGGADHLERALGILHRLAAAGALYPGQRKWIAHFEERLRSGSRTPGLHSQARQWIARLGKQPR